MLLMYATTSTLEIHMLDDSFVLVCLKGIRCHKKIENFTFTKIYTIEKS